MTPRDWLTDAIDHYEQPGIPADCAAALRELDSLLADAYKLAGYGGDQMSYGEWQKAQDEWMERAKQAGY